MMPDMGTVVISGNTYTVYGDKAGADVYFGARIGGEAWATLSAGTPEKALKTATDVFNRLGWVGEKTVSTQPLAWPRTGVTDREGNAIDPTIIPTEIIFGCYELAFALAQNPSILSNAQGTGSKIKSLQSDADRVEYFTWTDGTRWPTTVIDWISVYLTNGGSLAPDSGAGVAYGTTSKRTFDSCDRNGLDPQIGS